MGQTLIVLVPLLATVTCNALAIAGGESAVFLPALTALAVICTAAMCIVAFVVGLVWRIRWSVVLASIWVAIAAGWIATLFWRASAWFVLDENNLRCCNTMTLLCVTLLAASIALARPCLEIGIRARGMFAARNLCTETAD